MNSNEVTELIERYRAEAERGVSPEELYANLRKDGVSNLNAFVVLREFFDLTFGEFLRVKKSVCET